MTVDMQREREIPLRQTERERDSITSIMTVDMQRERERERDSTTSMTNKF